MSYEIFLEEEKKYLAHLHKQLKPAAYLRFLIWPAVITFPFGFHGVSVFNIRYQPHGPSWPPYFYGPEIDVKK